MTMANRLAIRVELARDLKRSSKRFRRWYWRFRSHDGLTPLRSYREALQIWGITT